MPVPAGARRIDATGKIVTPGFVDASTQLGVQEVAAVNDTRDMNARGKDNIAAAFTVWEGLNPNSVLLAPARKEGITSVVVVPTGGLISGQAALVDLVPGTTTEMIIHALRVDSRFERTIHCAAHQSTTVEIHSRITNGGFHAA